MPITDLIPPTQVAELMDLFSSFWETDMVHTVTIVKQPLETITTATTNQPYVPGYGTTSETTNVTLTPVSQDFDALLIEQRPDAKMWFLYQGQIPLGIVFMKVKKPARDYIMNGQRTLHVTLAGKNYNITSEESPAFFLTDVYYMFKLELIK
jgi:hypothetical protein